jgi:transposase
VTMRAYHQLPDADRWRIVRLVEEEGWTQAAAATAVGCSRATVNRVLSQWRTTEEVTAHHGGGAPKALNLQQLKKLEALIKKNPHDDAHALRAKLGLGPTDISTRTISRCRRQLQFTLRKEGTKVAKTEAQYDEQRLWARQHRRDPIREWLFMDEATCMLRHTGSLVWVKRGEPTPKHFIHHLYASVSVWGIVWWTGCCFKVYRGQPNTDRILDCMDDELSPHLPDVPGRTLLADKGGYHWTDPVREWYEAAGLVPLKMPTASPEFNAIEGVWAWVKDFVHKQGPKGVGELRAAMQLACDSVQQRVIQGHIREAERQIKAWARKR